MSVYTEGDYVLVVYLVIHSYSMKENRKQGRGIVFVLRIIELSTIKERTTDSFQRNALMVRVCSYALPLRTI